MTLPFHTLDEVDPSGKRVLVRVDLNVPVDASGRVTDTTRIRAAAATVNDLAARGARVVMLAHFGRPKGKPVEAFSLQPIAAAAAGVIGRPVAFAADCVGETARKAVEALHDGEVLLLENTRFHPGDETNDETFAGELAALGDLFVGDAFSAAHRAHASTVGVAQRLPAYAGRTMQAELTALERALGSPKTPVMAVVGGAKVSTKIPVLENLLARVDALVIGGGMANTFLLANGHAIGRSLAEPDLVETARTIMAKADENACTIVLPTDAVVASALAAGVDTATVPVDAVPDDKMILDIGPRSLAAVNAWTDRAATLVWNGPLGAFETPPFDNATVAAARHAAARTGAGQLLSVAGGGDTVAALHAAGVADDFSFVSTAGGAFLEWLEGRVLPGVEVLRRTAA